MAEYIEREAYYQQIDNLSKGKHGVYCAAINDCMNALDEQPAADVAEVKHGYWEEVQGQCFRCSECHRGAVVDIFNRFVLTKHCHNCGAKMDVENTNFKW